MSYWGSSYSLMRSQRDEEDEDREEYELREKMSITKDQMEELKQCFKLCDKSGKGNVTKIDLISLMKSVGEEIDDDDIKEIFYEIDVDSDGTVDFIDFLSFMSKIVKQKIPDEDVEKCFKVFNEEDDGYLTIRGLQRVFLSLGQKPSDEELKEMMAFIDPENQDGLIQYDVFKNYLVNENLLRNTEEEEEETDSEYGKSSAQRK